MRSIAATGPSTDSVEDVGARPRVGLLGIMQSLYDDMLPGIADRQAGYAADVAAALAPVADVEVSTPVKEPGDAERELADLSGRRLDGLIVAMLTYAPRCASRACWRRASAAPPRVTP
jgi:L-arabinose isomerase